MQRHSQHRRYSLGNNRQVVNLEASPRTSRSCSGTESGRVRDEMNKIELYRNTDDGCLDEPPGVTYRIKERQRFLHPVLSGMDQPPESGKQTKRQMYVPHFHLRKAFGHTRSN